MTRQVVCPSRLHGLSTPGNSQFAKLLFAALVCWMKELLLITDCVLYLIVLTGCSIYCVCVEKRAMSSSVLPCFKRPPQYAFCIGWRGRGGKPVQITGV